MFSLWLIENLNIIIIIWYMIVKNLIRIIVGRNIII